MTRSDFGDGLVQFWNGDCLERLGCLAQASVDLVFADLPYGETRNAWDRIIDPGALWDGLHRVAKPAAPIVLTASARFAAVMIASNSRNFRYDMVWRKNKASGHLNANRMPLRAHELILVFYRKTPLYQAQKTAGHRAVTKYRKGHNGDNYGASGRPVWGGTSERHPTSVLEIPVVNNDGTSAADGPKIHPTQKPVELVDFFVQSFTEAGATVLDPTAGSGTTGVAAVRAGRRAVLIEGDPVLYAKAVARVHAEIEVVSRER